MENSHVNLKEEPGDGQPPGCVERIIRSFLDVNDMKFNWKPKNAIGHFLPDGKFQSDLSPCRVCSDPTESLEPQWKWS